MSGEKEALTPQRFRKKPVVIEAFQWTADRDQGRDPEWIASAIHAGKVFFRGSNPENVKLVIATLEGHMVADRGDWIIRGIQGELYPCKPDIFEATYEPAGVPVVARDEASELRAAIKEWAEAKQAVDDADRAWTAAIDAGQDPEEHQAAWTKAMIRERATEAVLRRLAGEP